MRSCSAYRRPRCSNSFARPQLQKRRCRRKPLSISARVATGADPDSILPAARDRYPRLEGQCCQARPRLRPLAGRRLALQLLYGRVTAAGARAGISLGWPGPAPTRCCQASVGPGCIRTAEVDGSGASQVSRHSVAVSTRASARPIHVPAAGFGGDHKPCPVKQLRLEPFGKGPDRPVRRIPAGILRPRLFS